MQALYLNNNYIEDISFLEKVGCLAKFKVLDLSFNKLTDISSLSTLTELQALSLRANKISDISSLASLGNLQELYIGFNQISDIRPLASLTNLKWLGLKGNPLEGEQVTWLQTQLPDCVICFGSECCDNH